mmetsp:Transcript_14814/g.35310  ORF Transcript_14814/g.35310 Transcript_14814/m.35310 type:complete len:221 (-) Transcript_14814:1991-2653(-)
MWARWRWVCQTTRATGRWRAATTTLSVCGIPSTRPETSAASPRVTHSLTPRMKPTTATPVMQRPLVRLRTRPPPRPSSQWWLTGDATTAQEAIRRTRWTSPSLTPSGACRSETNGSGCRPARHVRATGARAPRAQRPPLVRAASRLATPSQQSAPTTRAAAGSSSLVLLPPRSLCWALPSLASGAAASREAAGGCRIASCPPPWRVASSRTTIPTPSPTP